MRVMQPRPCYRRVGLSVSTTKRLRSGRGPAVGLMPNMYNSKKLHRQFNIEAHRPALDLISVILEAGGHMVVSGINSDKPRLPLSVIELTIAICDIASQWVGCLDPAFLALANSLHESAGWALASSEPKSRTDWVNVHGAKVAALERGIATVLNAQLVGSEGIRQHVHASIERLGWSHSEFEELADKITGDIGARGCSAWITGRSIAQADELELATRAERAQLPSSVDHQPYPRHI